MMGAEPYIRALDDGAQVILGGRTSDPAPWAAAAIRAGMPPAPAWYAGKMLECGATPSIPKGHDCLIVGVRPDGIVAEPLNPIRRCTPLSIANHSLHENASPCIHVEPGGILDTTDCTFDALSDRSVLVSGMRWDKQPYTVKLEGTELVGYRAMTICGTRDPMLIGRFDSFIEQVRQAVADKVGGFGLRADQYQLAFRIYGKDGVMGAGEPVKEIRSHELGIVAEALADTQEIANAVLAFARVSLLHTDFPGRLCREGNMAFPFSPSDVELQPLYRFSIFHTVELEDPLSLFPIEYEDRVMPRISEIATVCKSKNAGPFELTIDVVFGSRELYDRVQATGVLNAALFARLYGISENQVLFTPYPAGNAFKATIPRRIPSGDVGDTDIYGAQQHAPLLDVEIPLPPDATSKA